MFVRRVFAFAAGALLALLTFAALPVAAAGAQQAAAQDAPRGAQPGARRKLAIAIRPIARGTVLSLDDFEYRDTTVRAVADTFTVAPGWVTRRMIAAGEVLRVPAVEAPAVVAANQPVELLYMNENVRLTLRGTAVRRGSVGERVTVRTEQGRRVEGTVIAPGRVRID